MSESLTFTLPDQRILEYAIYGAPAGTEKAVAVYFHGTPGCHNEAELVDDLASREGLRILAISRPGFSGSSPNPHLSILGFSQDVVALADHLGIERFALIGVSGGCPYALACLHTIPRERILNTTLIAGAYPHELGTSGMALAGRLLFFLAKWAPWLAAIALDHFLAGPQARDTEHPERFTETIKGFFKGLPAEDQAALQVDDGKVLDIAVKGARAGLRQGPKPSVKELGLIASPWGFKLEDLKVEKGQFIMWHGAKDANAPLKMAEKAAKVIQGAELRVVEDAAHLSLPAFKKGEIIAALLEAVSRS
ncbi:alpha/beta-hydrolase [Hypoxylon sp. FL1857]|nr:alpha/beta-hydrolase [Hypoxylon sp. FL1857]